MIQIKGFWVAAPSDEHNLQGLQPNLYEVFISGVTNTARIFTAVGAFVPPEAILRRRIAKAVPERINARAGVMDTVFRVSRGSRQNRADVLGAPRPVLAVRFTRVPSCWIF